MKFILLTLLWAFVAPVACAQMSTRQTKGELEKVTAHDIKAVTDAVAELIEAHYVDRTTGARISGEFITWRQGQWGVGANVSRKFNTTNSEGYRFGNQLYGTLDLYRSVVLGKLTVTPAVGIYAEYAGYGIQNGKALETTGGRLANATAGITLFSDRWTVGITGQKPITQRSASGHVVAKERLLVQLGFLF